MILMAVMDASASKTSFGCAPGLLYCKERKRVAPRAELETHM